MRTVARLLCWTAISAPILAQQPIAFEVASVKQRPMGGPISMIGGSPSGSRLHLEAMSLSDLISWAYNIKPWQVAGGPSWTGIQRDRTQLDSATRRFDIDAKAEGDEARKIKEFRQMMQALLTERFHLTFHRESRESPVYVLVADKNGPKLHESGPEAKGILRMAGRGKITGSGSTISQLVNWFSNANGVDRPIVDQTGFTGKYDFTLEWTNLTTTASDDTAPTIFTALREQLGLKLDPRRAPLEFIVIDRAEVPDGN
jgi:uncharacterized protein (TIGR03435 family)